MLLTGHQPAHNTESSCISLQNTIQTHLPLSLQAGKPASLDKETGGMSVPRPGTWCKDFRDSTHGVHAGASSSTAISAHQKHLAKGKANLDAVPLRPRAVPHGDRPGHTRTQQAPVTTLLQGKWALGPLAACGTPRQIVSWILFFWSKNEGSRWAPWS